MNDLNIITQNETALQSIITLNRKLNRVYLHSFPATTIIMVESGQNKTLIKYHPLEGKLFLLLLFIK